MNMIIWRLFAVLYTIGLLMPTCRAQGVDLSKQDSLELSFYDNDSTQLVLMNVHTEKFGCIDNSGNLIVPFEYDYLGKMRDGLRLAILDSKYGYLNELGDRQIDMQYLGANHFSNGKAIVINQEGFGVIDHTNQVVLPFIFGSLSTKDHNCYVFKKAGGKTGVMDAQSKVIVPEIYDNIRLKNDSFWVAMKDKKFEIFKYDGKRHLNEKFSYISKASYSGYISVGIEGKKGMLDKHFNWILPPRYMLVTSLFDNHIGAKDSLGWKVYNVNHEQVIDEVFDEISFLNSTHCIVQKNRRKNIINLKGERVLDSDTERVTKINGDKRLLHIDGYLYDGMTMNKFMPEQVNLKSTRPSFENGHLAVNINGKCAVIDTSGNFTIPPQYEYCEDLLSVGYLKVKDNDSDKWGIVNLENEILIPIKYKDVNHIGGSDAEAQFWIYDETSTSFFANQKILVSGIDSIVGYLGDYTFFRKQDNLGFINAYEGIFRMLDYDSIIMDRFPLVVKQDGKYGALDDEGNLNIPCQYNYLSGAGGFFIIKSGDKYGTLSKENKVLETPKFDRIEKRHFIMFGKAFINDKVGLLDTDGTLLLPVEYDALDVKVNGQVTAQKGDETLHYNCMELQIKATNE